MPARPKATPHVHISEPHVRVTEWRFAPGAETGWRRHEADYVVVPLADGDLFLEEPGGMWHGDPQEGRARGPLRGHGERRASKRDGLRRRISRIWWILIDKIRNRCYTFPNQGAEPLSRNCLARSRREGPETFRPRPGTRAAFFVSIGHNQLKSLDSWK